MSLSPLVTISAAYGAGGSRVAPLVAERLHIPFAERLMPRGVADRISGPWADARRDDQPPGLSLGRLLRQLAGERQTATEVLEQADGNADDEYRRANEEAVLEHVDHGGVILGRGAAVVLRDVPHALHVRMTGPRDLRIEQAMVRGEIDRTTARWRQATEDLARDEYIRHFYGVDPQDAGLYHLTIDSTRLPLEACVATIAGAAAALAG